MAASMTTGGVDRDLARTVLLFRGGLARRTENEDRPLQPPLIQVAQPAGEVPAGITPLTFAEPAIGASDEDTRAAIKAAVEAYTEKHGPPEMVRLGDDAALTVTYPQADAQQPLAGRVAVVTGAAGAIGRGICRGLVELGASVAATDLAGDNLDKTVTEFAGEFGERVTGVPLDVTSADSVTDALAAVTLKWGGVDIVIANAGLAHVAGLDELKLEDFRRLARVNIEGTLLVLSEASRWLVRQGVGGDMVLISTKNVFAPGARFGAYSATKAAAHQLARIASLELAPHDIRVNMVSPDAVFSEGSVRSGLWAEVGPDRMKARGLNEAQLEEYYRSRNLLKARVTARHVANAVNFLVTRQTPTTGATIPVDGGLPDATPR